MSSMLHLHNKKNDGDGVDCEYFQRKARALERYCAVIEKLQKHAVKLLSDNDNSVF